MHQTQFTEERSAGSNRKQHAMAVSHIAQSDLGVLCPDPGCAWGGRSGLPVPAAPMNLTLGCTTACFCV